MANVILVNSWLFTHPADRKQHFHSLELEFLTTWQLKVQDLLSCSSVLVSTNSWEKHPSVQLLDVHQLVTTFVSVQFDAGKETYSGFIKMFFFSCLKPNKWSILIWAIVYIQILISAALNAPSVLIFRTLFSLLKYGWILLGVQAKGTAHLDLSMWQIRLQFEHEGYSCD